MKHWIFALFFALASPASLRAAPFEEAEVTKAINLVSLLPRDIRAVPGDVVKGDTALRTGGDSRAELQFPDLTITRVGSNTLFRFIAGTRDIVLDAGTMLFSSPKGAGGGKVLAGAITAAVTGSDFLISNAGRVKVISLTHKVIVYFTANPKIRAILLPGQMLDIAPGAEKKMPPIVTVDLGTLLATSMLGEAGGFGLLPSQAILTQNAAKQKRDFVLAGGASQATGPPAMNSTSASALPANGPLPANVNLAAQTAQTARSTEVANNNPPSQSSTGGQPPGTTDAVSGGNGGNNPSSRNRGNSANIANNQNRGNSGNRGNNANIANNQNRGNSGNRGNNANIANNQNRGNSGNRGNNANIANNQNRGNSGNR